MRRCRSKVINYNGYTLTQYYIAHITYDEFNIKYTKVDIYLERRKRSGITFCRDAQNQKIGEPTNLKREHVVRTKFDIYV